MSRSCVPALGPFRIVSHTRSVDPHVASRQHRRRPLRDAILGWGRWRMAQERARHGMSDRAPRHDDGRLGHGGAAASDSDALTAPQVANGSNELNCDRATLSPWVPLPASFPDQKDELMPSHRTHRTQGRTRGNASREHTHRDAPEDTIMSASTPRRHAARRHRRRRIRCALG